MYMVYVVDKILILVPASCLRW